MTTPQATTLGTPAPDFALPATDGKTYRLRDIASGKGAVIAFICNHCPYVKSAIDRLAEDARVLLAEGIGFAAICSNDAAAYPEDGLLRGRCAGHAQISGRSRCGLDHAAGVRRKFVGGM